VPRFTQPDVSAVKKKYLKPDTSRLKVGAEFSALPPLDDMSPLSGQALGAVTEKHAALNAQVFQESTQLVFAGMGQSLGIPSKKTFKEAKKVLGKSLGGVQGEILEAIKDFGVPLPDAAKTILARDMGDALAGFAKRTMKNIPFVGLITDVVMAVRGLFEWIADSWDEDIGSPPLMPMAKYSRLADVTMLEDFILAPTLNVETRDWTKIYMPQYPGGPQSVFKLEGGYKGLMGGVGNLPATNGLGYIPSSLGKIHVAIEFAKGGAHIRDTGSFFPAAAQQAYWLWESVMMRNAPQLYTVTIPEIRDAWRGYLLRFRAFIADTDGISESQKEALFVYLNQVFGYKGNMLFGSSKIAESIGRVGQRQKHFLDSLTVAYVDESFAAIARDSLLHQKWEANRALLLKHPDRFSIDLQDVPDFQYRDKLKASGVGKLLPPKLTLKEKFAPPDKAPPPIPSVGYEYAGPPRRTGIPSWFTYGALATGGYLAWKKWG
jgi:hypothetical protein